MNCIIIHGCPSKERSFEESSYYKHWIPWLKKELIKNNIFTETPLMPKPWLPEYEDFKKEFEKYEVNEDTILVGHSCGCAFLVQWLGETKQKIHKLVLVAPWKVGKNEIKKEFYGFEIDSTIKDRVDEIIMFTADDERKDGKVSLRMYQEVLGGKIIELKGHGHYTMGEMGKEELPELLDVIL